MSLRSCQTWMWKLRFNETMSNETCSAVPCLDGKTDRTALRTVQRCIRSFHDTESAGCRATFMRKEFKRDTVHLATSKLIFSKRTLHVSVGTLEIKNCLFVCKPVALRFEKRFSQGLTCLNASQSVLMAIAGGVSVIVNDHLLLA